MKATKRSVEMTIPEWYKQGQRQSMSFPNDPFKDWLPDFSSHSIKKVSLKGNELTLEVDAGAYRMISEKARAKKISSKRAKEFRQRNEEVKKVWEAINSRKESIYQLSVQTWKGVPKELKLSKPSRPELLKTDFKTFEPFLSTEGEVNAYIKSYFLYEYLILMLKASGKFSVKEFAQSLRGFEKERITAKDCGSKIRNILGRIDCILYVDTSDYTKSLKSQTFKHKYRYLFHPESFACDSRKQKIRIKYWLVDNIKSIIWNQEWIIRDPEKLVMVEEVISELVDKKDVQLREISRARTTSTNPCNELTISEKHFPFSIYRPDYTQLELTRFPKSILLECDALDKLLVWQRYHNQEANITDCSRLWHPFHNLPRAFRSHITFNGSNLVEAMDVKSCFYVLMCKAMEIADGIDKKELQQFCTLVREGDIYTEMGNHVMCVSPFPDGLDNDAEDCYLAFIGMKKRDVIKQDMQSFRNIKSFNQAHHQYPMLANHFKKLFPTITEWLFNYPTHINAKGEEVKKLQHDMSRIETMLISRVCLTLVEMGVTPFTLHDAVYLSEAELGKLKNGQETVKEIFWKVFDSTTTEEIKTCLGEKTIEKNE